MNVIQQIIDKRIWIAVGKAVLILAILVRVVFFNSPNVFATGGNIEVISSHYKVDFPRGITFQLDVRSDADIVDIKLFYRFQSSRTTTYSYPEFKPSKKVEAIFNLDTSVSGYIPPGAHVEYFYEITDSANNQYTTKETAFTYFDPRFKWNITRIGSLRLLSHGLSISRLERLAGEVEKKLDDLASILKLKKLDPFTGVIYNSRKEALPAFPYQSDTITQEQVFEGFAFSESRLFVGIGLSTSLVVHESAHLILSDFMESFISGIPTWVNEGFASYAGDSRSYTRFNGSRAPALRSMSSMPGKPQDIRQFYDKSESVVAYLLENYNEDQFRRFLLGFKSTTDVDRALFEAYGFEVDELDQRWMNSLSRVPSTEQDGLDTRYKGERGLLVFQNFTTLLIGGLVVVTAAILGMNLLLNKMRQTSAVDDGLLGDNDDQQYQL